VAAVRQRLRAQMPLRGPPPPCPTVHGCGAADPVAADRRAPVDARSPSNHPPRGGGGGALRLTRRAAAGRRCGDRALLPAGSQRSQPKTVVKSTSAFGCFGTNT